MKFIPLKSPNFSKKNRKLSDIKFLILHYTGMQSIRVSINRLIDPKYKVSCHYLICQEGRIYHMVNDLKIAWHAGKSKWRNFENLNSKSIGIELQNKGHKLGYQNYSLKQTNSLISLVKQLKKKYNIKNHNILAHSDIAPLRKSDPGEKFPWKKLIDRKLINASNYRLNEVFFKKRNLQNQRIFFFKNLYKIGYRYFNKKKKSTTDKYIIKSFQMKFRQNKIDGKIDLECLKISDILAKKS